MPRDLHPIHARGVRSPNRSLGFVGAALTDAKIEDYIRKGYYGTEKQRELLALDAEIKSHAAARKRRPSPLTLAISLLSDV